MNKFKVGDVVWHNGEKLEVKWNYTSELYRLTNGMTGRTVSIENIKPIKREYAILGDA